MKLFAEIEDNPYSKPYMVVLMQLGGPPATKQKEPVQVESTLKELFLIESVKIS